MSGKALAYDVAVLGGGPAGLAAALYAREANPDCKIAILERDARLGGILRQCIHNGFGLHYFREELTGPEYAARFADRIGTARIDVWTDTMALSFDEGGEIRAVGPAIGAGIFRARSIVLAMGCRERPRGALRIAGTRPAGVYTAGSAQRLVNIYGKLPGRRVAILGSGDIGLIMARRFVWEGAEVPFVAEILPHSSGLNRNIAQCLEDNGIPLWLSHTVVSIRGRERVEGVTVARVDPETLAPIRGTERDVPCDTLLLSVGLIPENELTRGAGVEIDPRTGGATVDERRETSMPGVFACGNALHVHDLVDFVSEEAAIAGKSAADSLTQGRVRAERRAVRPGAGVRYVVPQWLSRDAKGRVEAYFRVERKLRDATVCVDVGGNTVLRVKRPVLAPGEMERVALDAAAIDGDATIRIEGGAV